MSRPPGGAEPASATDPDARAATEEVVVGLVRFWIGPRRRPRPAPLAEEDLLWRRLRQRLGDRGLDGVAPKRFAEWWSPTPGAADKAPQGSPGRARNRA